MKKQYLSLLVSFASALLISQNLKADIWTVVNKWSPQVELAYQIWIETFAQTDMFTKPTIKLPRIELDAAGAVIVPVGDAAIMSFVNAEKELAIQLKSHKASAASYVELPNPYYNLKTDCADTVYAMRIIFSAKFGLPWAMKDPSSVSITLRDSLGEVMRDANGVAIKDINGKIQNPTQVRFLTQMRNTYPAVVKNKLNTKRTIYNDYDKINQGLYDAVDTQAVDPLTGVEFCQDLTTRSKKCIDFDGLDYDLITDANRRLRLFIAGKQRLVSTGSIQHDTYPVSYKAIKSGTILLTSHVNHHSWTIVGRTPEGNPRMIYNSVVGRQSGSEVQQRSSWPNPKWVFQDDEKIIESTPKLDALGMPMLDALTQQPLMDNKVERIPIYHPGSYAGFRYWIPYDQMALDPATGQFPIVAEASEDQFSIPLKKWTKTLTVTMRTRVESLEATVDRLLADVCADIEQRAKVIADAEKYKAEQNVPEVQCLNAMAFDELSTPSRDKRLFDSLMLARVYFQKGLKSPQGEAAFPNKIAQFKKIFPEALSSAKREARNQKAAAALDADSICKISVGSQEMDLAEVKRRFFRNNVSPNPNETTSGRWGLVATPSEFAKSCPAYDYSFTGFDVDLSEKNAMEQLEAESGL